ncbi:hypothetical protein [Pseudarthrobacter sp. S6]|uniref:hypothetical protein n=1 Tax=Pseudarthrobacter sp. S6 TaxID=3418420 RepID=UPI003482FF36
MHKYSAQTAKEPLAGADAALMAEAANVEATVAETPTPAEQVVDQLRQERSQDTTLTPEQERAERIAAMARRIKGTSNTSTPEQSPEAVTEAMKDIAERRRAEKDTQPAAPAESLRDRLARVRQETEATLGQTPNAAEKIRQAQQAQEAEDAKRRAQQTGPATGPEAGRRGPRL